MKFGLSLLLFSFSVGAFAASSSGAINTTTSSSSWYDQLRESPASLTVISSNDIKRIGNTSKIAGVQSANYIIGGYKLNSRGSLSLENLIIQDSGSKTADASTVWNRTTLKYSHKILTQDKYGVNLTGAADLRYYPDKDERNVRNYTSQSRLRAKLSRSFKNGLSLSGELLYYNKHKRNDTQANTTGSLWQLFTVQSYDITDALSVYTYEDSVIVNRENAVKKARTPLTIEVGAGVDYVFNKYFTGELEVGNNLFVSNDDRLIAEDFMKTLSYTAALTISLF
jgi:outer membrane receptor for ferrienterochelin and colicin